MLLVGSCFVILPWGTLGRRSESGARTYSSAETIGGRQVRPMARKIASLRMSPDYTRGWRGFRIFASENSAATVRSKPPDGSGTVAGLKPSMLIVNSNPVSVLPQSSTVPSGMAAFRNNLLLDESKVAETLF